MIGTDLPRSKRIRRRLLLLAWVVVLALLWLARPVLCAGGLPPIGDLDFVQHWSAARLTLLGGDPYDDGALLAVEQAAGWSDSQALMMYSPPWALALILPLATIPYAPAILIWFVLNLMLVLASGVLLWRYFAPGDRRFWVGPVLVVAFAPTLFALRNTQITTWLLVGVVGFLWCERTRRDALAGASLALLAIKPHIAFLFYLGALWWIWRSRRWRVLGGWLGTLLAASGIVLLFSPHLFASYLVMPRSPLLEWATPTLGMWLRIVLGPERHWLQFLPTVVGLLGLVLWLWRRHGPWRWQDVTSPLLLASALTTAFGWSYDQAVLLPVVVDLVSRLRGAALSRQLAVLGAFALSQLGLWVLNYLGFSDVYSVWAVPVLAGLYWWAVRYELKHRNGKQQACEGMV